MNPAHPQLMIASNKCTLSYVFVYNYEHFCKERCCEGDKKKLNQATKN